MRLDGLADESLRSGRFMVEPVNIDRVLAEVEEGVRRGVAVYVSGADGSGRRTLFNELRQMFPRSVAIDLLPLREADAPITAVLEVLAALGIPRDPALGDSDAVFSVAQSAARALEGLAGSERPLILRVPRDWGMVARQDETDDPTLSQADAFLRGITATRAPIVLIADAYLDRRRLLRGAVRELHLPVRDVSLSSLDGAANWGPLRASVSRLVASGVRSGAPARLRLAVGAVFAGMEPSEVSMRLADEAGAIALARTIVATLRANRDARCALDVVAELRVAMSLADLRPLLPADETLRALITECLGYGVDHFRLCVEAREALRAADPPREDAHRALAALHQRRDGAVAPDGLRQDEVRHWAEKVHHLGAAGTSSDAAWRSLDLPAPAFYWDRARAQSHRGEYARAADTYRACIRRFPEDDYSWHYLGFNLARDHAEPEEIERAYREAVRLAPQRTWWNGRLVSFLIQQRRYGDARRVWSAARPHVIDDASGLCRDGITAMQLHRWVVQDWLAAGRVAEASEVLAEVDRAVVEADPSLRALSERVAAAREGGDPRWLAYLAQGPGEPEERESLQALWRELGARSGAPLPVPILEAVDGAQRMTWQSRKVLVQVDRTPEGEVEWYAREHATRRSEADVGGPAVLNALIPWLQRLRDDA